MLAVESSELTLSLLVAEEGDSTVMLCVVTERCHPQ